MFGQFSLAKAALLAASLVNLSSAQTTTSCDPLQKSCPNDPALDVGTFTTDFRNAKSIPNGWEQVNGGAVTFDDKGANIVLKKQGDSPILQTNFYFLFGSFEAKVKASAGTGIVSSIVLLSDDRDEVDWEFTGTNTAQIQSNYFGKGDDSTFDRAAWHAVGTPQNTYHTYKVDWTPDLVTWSIDGAAVRTLKYADAAGGTRFPQTPMRVKIGIWAGGDPTNPEGTIQWAGGKTDFTKAPFSMQVESVTIVNYTPAKEYSFQDKSGSYQKIGVVGGTLLSNANGKANTVSVLSATTSLSKATAVPSNIVQQGNSTRNATITTSATSATLAPSGGATRTGSGSGASSSSTGTAASAAESLTMTGISSIAFGAVAFMMAVFV